MNLVQWPLMGGPVNLVHQAEDWAGPQSALGRAPVRPGPSQAPPSCTNCSRPPNNSQCTNRIAVR